MPNLNHNMGRRPLLQWAAASLWLSVSHVGFAASSYVIAVHVWASSTYTRITLESNVALKYQQFVLTCADQS